MNSNCRRFLALNCILNGHVLTDAFDGDEELAVKTLGLNDITDLHGVENQLKKLEKSKVLKEYYHPVTLTLLNFFRNKEYAFVYVPNSGPVSIPELVVTDRNGGISDDVREAFLSRLVRNISFVKNEKDTRFADGVLYLPKMGQDEISGYMVEAYNLFCYGPQWESGEKPPRFISNRNFVELSGYSGMSVSNFKSCLTGLLSGKYPPSFYCKTTLMIPDYMEIYNATGCVMEWTDDQSSTNVRWLLDVTGSDKCKVLTVPSTAVHSLIITSLMDLSNMGYTIGAPNNGLVVKDA